MGRIARQAVRLLPGVNLGRDHRIVRLPAADRGPTDIRVLVVDDEQYTTDDGPCLRAMRTGVRLSMTLDKVRRW